MVAGDNPEFKEMIDAEMVEEPVMEEMDDPVPILAEMASVRSSSNVPARIESQNIHHLHQVRGKDLPLRNDKRIPVLLAD